MQLTLFGSVHKTDLLLTAYQHFLCDLKPKTIFDCKKNLSASVYCNFLRRKMIFRDIKSFYITHSLESCIHGISNGICIHGISKSFIDEDIRNWCQNKCPISSCGYFILKMKIGHGHLQ